MADVAAVSPRDLRKTARHGLVIYFALVVVISDGLEAYDIFINPDAFGTLFGLLALMWSPALASVIARLIPGRATPTFPYGWGATYLAVVRAWSRYPPPPGSRSPPPSSRWGRR